MKTLLAIVQQAMAEMGQPQPIQVTTNVDAGVLQALALLNAEGEELSQTEGGWPALRGEYLITLIPGQEAYPFPSDLQYFLGGTMWDRSTHWQAIGPLSASEWQLVRSGIFPGGVNIRYRIMDGQIHFDPVPTTNDTVVVEYMSSNWCQSAAGAAQAAFLADTDVPLLPDRLFILGLKWRYLAAKGMNYAEEKAAYDLALARLRARSETLQALPLNRRFPRFGTFNDGLIPSFNWPGR